MLFFDDSILGEMKKRFAESCWPDFDEAFLFQPIPATFQGGYDVLRYNGREFANARVTDVKFASWIITENSVAFRLCGDRKHLDHAAGWVRAALNTQHWHPQFKGNTDLFYGNLLYALSMFLDLCSDAIDAEFRRHIEQELLTRGRTALEWLTTKPPYEQRYTQNHFYIPLTGLLCAVIALRERHPETTLWIERLRIYPPLIFDAMGRDGYFFEGPDYFHYAFIWAVRLAELSERHLDQRVATLPCFAKLKHFLKWMYFPKGDCMFAIGDASAKEYNYSRWSEQEQGQKLMSDNRLQNFSHVLMWTGSRNEDREAIELAKEIKSRGKFHWYEGFWCLAWDVNEGDTGGEAGAEASGLTYLFDDYGVWCCDAHTGDRHLRIVCKCGAPLGKSLAVRDGKPAFAYDAGHCAPDAGSVLAAIDDVPVFVGPGYMGRKSGCYLNTLTFDGRGQQDDRIYHALDAPAIDYSRFDGLYIEPKNHHRVVMEFSKVYADVLGVQLAKRGVEVMSAKQFEIDDLVQLSMHRRPEARFRITDPPVELRRDRVVWRVGSRQMQFDVVDASADFQIFVHIGEVISINDDGRPGPFEAGSINQRGYQILVRPIDKVRDWHARYSITIA